METERSNQPNRFKVTGPVGAEEAQAAQPYFDAQSECCGAQYLNCREGGGRAQALLYHLIDVESGDVVGFMGFETTMLAYGEHYPPDAMLSFEYVYIAPAYRNQKLSKLFIDFAIDRSRTWIADRAAEHSNTGITVRSASIAESSSGRTFLETFDKRLAEWCCGNSIEFKDHFGR